MEQVGNTSLSSMDDENIGLIGPQRDPSKVNSSKPNTNVKHDYAEFDKNVKFDNGHITCEGYATL
jgi:hypothetical protein